MRRFARFLLFPALLLAGASSSAANRDWAQTAVDDLHFIRATLRENHPGPVDAQSPAFRDWFRSGFDQAIERAQRATDFAGYFFSIQYYMAGFNDGHLGALTERHLRDHLSEKRLQRRWPRFLVGAAGDAFVVTYVEVGALSAPAKGDRLISCDGVDATALGRRLVGDYTGLWTLASERRQLAPLLFIDEGNPFVKVPQRCDFAGAGVTRTIRLDWAPIDGSDLLARLPEDPVPAMGIREVGDGFWITIPTFDLGDAASGAALARLTADVSKDAARIRGARRVVFDVRGNRGGSSDAGRALLVAIWGEPLVSAVEPRAPAIDWRLSAGNVRFLRDSNLKTLRRQFGEDSEQARDYAAMVDAMQKALDRDETFYTESAAAPPLAPASPAPPVRPILLTDEFCASACLDFADIVLRLPGARHFGRETSADALSIDNRGVQLPSGIGWLGFSMKVYRGRVRGNNEPYRPQVPWQGDMRDTAALERWIFETN